MLFRSGLAELVQREDIKKSILKAYNKIEVYEGNTDRSTKEYKKAVDNEWRTKLLEVIVAQLDSFTDSDTHILIEEAIYNSSSMKLKNPDFYGKNSTVYYKTLKSKYGIDSFSYYVYDIYTPNGTQVVAQYIEDDDEWKTEVLQKIDDDYKKKYPAIKKVGNATFFYLCHTYAWYSQSPSRYHIDPEPYMTDGSYTKVQTPYYG